ncbi:HAMP domain-containing histidine kinase [Paucibacter sp. DJ1R-11]|uniref:sensor histidine kinase n=1 Tax=Paucibacter sp. DJ1R-11 TaxID=2893556 RepID=UPI0021E42863|nr:HAMP domain-containing sensor histidine kinase [Paucibacter sp. DJ1R-11]MCV2364807.1 HAMP domain-containing histidine kinase [Paucibacter sp. DJ1R-11]
MSSAPAGRAADPGTVPPAGAGPFRLTRWFIGLAALVIVLIAVAHVWAISRFLSEQLFQREAATSRDFVQNVLLADGSYAYLERPEDASARERFKGSVLHLSHMPDVLRANVYRRDGQVLWSSNPGLIGQRFADNDELEAAERGELVVHAGRISPDERSKAEHIGLAAAVSFYVETYIPVLNPAGQVVGVIELYKAPLALTEAIERGRLQVAGMALAGALLLFLSLYGLVRRADHVMQRQHAQLLEGETLAVIGELAASVAHNIRNPLASIRSAAELSLEAPQEHAQESARDILAEVDRISQRISELLRLSSLGSASPERLALWPLLQSCVAEQQAAFQRRGQRLVLGEASEADRTAALIRGDAQLLRSMIESLLSNASEAMVGMAEGAEARIELDRTRRGCWRLRLLDRGQGIAAGQHEQVLRPFYSTKPQGLGLGLPLARRIVERLGGRIWLEPRSGGGTCVCIELPQA